MTDEPTPLDKLTAAIQEFVNAISEEGPALLDSAVVVWETMRYDEGGDLGYRIDYANAGRASMSATAGLLRVGLDQVLGDLTE